MQETNRPRTEVVEALVENHRQFLAFIERRVGNPSDAEEILQTAFVKGIEKGNTLRDDESVVAWFYRVLRNALIDDARHRDAEQRALEREAALGLDPVHRPPEFEQAICQCVLDLLPGLKQDYARLLERVDLENGSIAEAAEEFGLTANNTRVKLHRARAALRKQLVLSCGTCTEHGCLDCTCSRGSAAP